MNPQQQRFLDKCHEIAQFCRMHGANLFADWPENTLLFYVAYHALHGSLFVRRAAGHVCAAGFAWPETRSWIEETVNPGRHTFRWKQESLPDCVFVAEIVGTRKLCRSIWRQAREQWPMFNRFITFRRGKLHEMNAAMERFC